MSKVEYTPKAVIENKLLAALDEPGNVAIIATKDDLDLIIRGIGLIPWDDRRKLGFLEDLKKLRAGSFPEGQQ